MSKSLKPEPPRPCLICKIAMVATSEEDSVVHRCDRCGTVITVVKRSGERE